MAKPNDTPHGCRFYRTQTARCQYAAQVERDRVAAAEREARYGSAVDGLSDEEARQMIEAMESPTLIEQLRRQGRQGFVRDVLIEQLENASLAGSRADLPALK